jgi:phytoene dehydrogenase-like protein
MFDIPTGEDSRGPLGPLLSRNAALRNVFADDPASRARLKELQDWQARRLARTYADIAEQPRYRLAVKFFLDELYGGGDPQARDRDLAKVQRVMEALLPRDALRALNMAIELEILSQELDAEVVRDLPPGRITEKTYAEGYRCAGQRSARERQIALTGEVGRYLDGVVRKPLIRALVRFARGPAHAAGFGTLQEFLERGLDAFERLRGADDFLGIIHEREMTALGRLFDDKPDPFGFGGAD